MDWNKITQAVTTCYYDPSDKSCRCRGKQINRNKKGMQKSTSNEKA